MNTEHLILQAINKGHHTKERILAWMLDAPGKDKGWHIHQGEFFDVAGCLYIRGDITKSQTHDSDITYTITPQGQARADVLAARYHAFYDK